MIEHGIGLEHIQYASEAALGLYALAMAYTTKQRMWFRERDDHTCQACRLRIPHVCNGNTNMKLGERRLQVHHLIPQRYARAIGLPNADFPENGITLCESFHQRVIHPDMKEALDLYRRGDKDSFRRVGINRDAILNEGVIYWNDEHDRVLSTRAIQNTQRFTKPFPTKK